MTRLNGYKTKQRDEIFTYFEQHPGQYVTARELIAYADDSMGEATVYRTLAKFVREGILHKIVNQDSGGVYYQYDPQDRHKSCFRLECTGCGRLIRLECGFAQNMEQHIRAEHNFTVNCADTVIYGMCSDCGRRA